jgi:hypothetical protein
MGPFGQPQPLRPWDDNFEAAWRRGYNMYGDAEGNLFGDEGLIRENNNRWAQAARYQNRAAELARQIAAEQMLRRNAFARQRPVTLPMTTKPGPVSSPFSSSADSWMRRPEVSSRIEGFDPDQSYAYIDPSRMDAIRSQRSGGRFQ